MRVILWVNLNGQKTALSLCSEICSKWFQSSTSKRHIAQTSIHESSADLTLSSWLDKNAHTTPLAQGHEKPAEKLAAHLMGRWKNGTPVHESPDKDDNPQLFKSNNFDYEPREKHDKCPFAAHTRKMRPRADLSHDHAVIIRRGIPYGPEVTSDEKAAKKTEQDRGLLFTCYQSDIRNGFNFLTTRESFAPNNAATWKNCSY